MTDCNIFDNQVGGFNAVAKSGSTFVYIATDNWWGTVSKREIESMIYHHADSAIFPWVKYTPFATEPYEIADPVPPTETIQNTAPTD